MYRAAFFVRSTGLRECWYLCRDLQESFCLVFEGRESHAIGGITIGGVGGDEGFGIV